MTDLSLISDKIWWSVLELHPLEIRKSLIISFFKSSAPQPQWNLKRCFCRLSDQEVKVMDLEIIFLSFASKFLESLYHGSAWKYFRSYKKTLRKG